jgi:hypothetical protein
VVSQRAERVKADLTELARNGRSKVTRAQRQCEDTERTAGETTGQLGSRWNRRIQFMRQRPGAAKADWRNDQMTDG